MLKKSASGVLASLRGSTYPSVRLAFSLTAALPAEWRALARRGWAGEKPGLFEHPETIYIGAIWKIPTELCVKIEFSRSLRKERSTVY